MHFMYLPEREMGTHPFKSMVTRKGKPVTMVTRKGKPVTMVMRKGKLVTMVTRKGNPVTMVTRKGKSVMVILGNRSKPKTASDGRKGCNVQNGVCNLIMRERKTDRLKCLRS